jgi:hypothetical protein
VTPEYGFPQRLRDQRERAGKTHEDVDRHLAVTRGSCEAWEAGILEKPDEAVMGNLAVLLDCSPSSLDGSIHPGSNGQLLAFARNFAEAVAAGLVQPQDCSRKWKEASATMAFRGAADDGFWKYFFEKNQRPPELGL